jgi:MFS family permease
MLVKCTKGLHLCVNQGLLASWVSNRFGRRLTMILGGFAFIVGSIMQATADVIAPLVVGRIILGLAIGFATQVRQTYEELAMHGSVCDTPFPCGLTTKC